MAAVVVSLVYVSTVCIVWKSGMRRHVGASCGAMRVLMVSDLLTRSIARMSSASPACSSHNSSHTVSALLDI